MILKYTLAAVLISGAAPALALAQTSSGGSQSGQQFLQQVEKDSMNEIHEALLAEQKSHNPMVQAYARLIINDHTMLASELSAVAHETSFTMSGNEQAGTQAPSNLQSANGTQFDRDYIQHELQQNQQSLQTWEQEAKGNGPVSEFAKIALPVQRQHVELAQAIQPRLQNSQANNG